MKMRTRCRYVIPLDGREHGAQFVLFTRSMLREGVVREDGEKSQGDAHADSRFV